MAGEMIEIELDFLPDSDANETQSSEEYENIDVPAIIQSIDKSLANCNDPEIAEVDLDSNGTDPEEIAEVNLDNSNGTEEIADSQFESNSESESDNVEDDYYEIESEENEVFPLPQGVPIVNSDFRVEDEKLWSREEKGCSLGPFLGSSRCNFETTNNPEDYFNAFFDQSMWSIIVDQTNTYARQKIRQKRGMSLILHVFISTSLPPYSSCKLNIFWSNRHTFGVNATQVGVLEKPWK